MKIGTKLRYIGADSSVPHFTRGKVYIVGESTEHGSTTMFNDKDQPILWTTRYLNEGLGYWEPAKDTIKRNLPDWF